MYINNERINKIEEIMQKYSIPPAQSWIFSKAKEYAEEHDRVRKRMIELATMTVNSIKDEKDLRWLVYKTIQEFWTWKIGEAPGPFQQTKYIGQRFWTLDALKEAENHLTNSSLQKVVTHEHVIPREMLGKLIERNPELCSSILGCSTVCIIKKSQHIFYDTEFGWEKYLKRNFQVVDLISGEILDSVDLEKNDLPFKKIIDDLKK